MQANSAKQMIALMSSVSDKTLNSMAEALGHTGQWLYVRTKSEKFSLEEWKQLCDHFDFDFEINLKDRNSDTVITWTGTQKNGEKK